MYSIANHARTVCRAHASASGSLLASTTLAPRCQSRSPVTPPVPWPAPPSRSYFFNAPHQTSLTLRALLRASKPGSEPLGLKSANEFLGDAMNSLASSICPQMDDSYQSRCFFENLMSIHLSGLNTEELQLLIRSAKTAGCDGLVTEAMLTDRMFEKFAFANGPLTKQQRLLMVPEKWTQLVDHLCQMVKASNDRLPPGSLPDADERRNTRHQLAHAARWWEASDHSLNTLRCICHELCVALGLPEGPADIVIVSEQSGGSLIDWRGSDMQLNGKVFGAIRQDANGSLFSELMRDVIEAALIRRIAGPDVSCLAIQPDALMLVYRTIDDIVSEPPAMPSPHLRDAAARLVEQSGQLGAVQILPTIGVSTGHAWIGNALSVVPDRTRQAASVGSRHMWPGYSLSPEISMVREWPIRWMTSKENEDLYPASHAWHISVPVTAPRLQESALQVAQAWKNEGKRYRFIGAEPGMKSQGCRASVMAAVTQGMDGEARALFEHFNAGLAEPDSPTEIALRMNRFMQWARELATASEMPIATSHDMRLPSSMPESAEPVITG